LLYIYSTPPDDRLQICPKYVKVDSRNKPRINNASSWFSLHGYAKIVGRNQSYGKRREAAVLILNSFSLIQKNNANVEFKIQYSTKPKGVQKIVSIKMLLMLYLLTYQQNAHIQYIIC